MGVASGAMIVALTIAAVESATMPAVAIVAARTSSSQPGPLRRRRLAKQTAGIADLLRRASLGAQTPDQAVSVRHRCRSPSTCPRQLLAPAGANHRVLMRRNRPCGFTLIVPRRGVRGPVRQRLLQHPRLEALVAFVRPCLQRSVELEFVDRAVALASLTFTALIPLSIFGGLRSTIIDLSRPLASAIVALVFAAVIWLCIPWVLLSRRVPWRALVPTALAIGGLIYMPRSMASSAASYGTIGVAIALVSWFVAAGFDLVGGTAVGAFIAEARPSAAAQHGASPCD